MQWAVEIVRDENLARLAWLNPFNRDRLRAIRIRGGLIK